MSRCATRSLWIAGVHVDTRRFPVTLADGTPLRLTASGPGVHARDLTGPMLVTVTTPAGPFTAVLDPATCFGRHGRGPADVTTAAAVTAVAAALGAPGAAGRAAAAALAAADPALITASAAAAADLWETAARLDPTASWVVHAAAAAVPADECPLLATVAAAVTGADRVDGLPVAGFVGRLAPDVRLAALAAVASHASPSLLEDLALRELTVWHLPERSAVLDAVLTGDDVAVLTRLARSNERWDRELLPFRSQWAIDAATHRLQTIWTEQAAAMPAEDRRRLVPGPSGSGSSPGGDWKAGQRMRARAAVAAFTVDDVAWAAATDPDDPRSPFNLLVTSPTPVDADVAASLHRLRDRVDDGDGIRWALLTLRFGTDHAELADAAAVLADRVLIDEDWPGGEHPDQLFADAVMVNSSLTDDDRRRLIGVERACFDVHDPHGRAGALTFALARRADPTATYRLMRAPIYGESRETWFVDAVAQASTAWPTPQLLAAARARPTVLLDAALVSTPLRFRLAELAADETVPLPEPLRGFTAVDSAAAATVLERVAAGIVEDPDDDGYRHTGPFWDAATGVLRNPFLSPAAKASLLGSDTAAAACPDVFPTMGLLPLTVSRPLNELLERTAAQWRAGNFAAVHRTTAYGVVPGSEATQVLLWLTAFGVAHPDRDLVDTVWSLAGSWNGPVTDLVATARAIT